MPIRPSFDWNQTNKEIQLHIYFKSGVKRESVDVLLTDTFIKVNASPTYLLHVDLLYEIIPEETRYYFDAEKAGILHINGKKAIAGKEWERLTVNEEDKKSQGKSSALVTELSIPPGSSLGGGAPPTTTINTAISATSPSGGNSPRTTTTTTTTTAAAAAVSIPFTLSLPAVLMSKKDVLARRQKSLLRAEQKYNEMLEKRKQQREAEGRRLTAAQWDVDKEKRQTIERRMRAEKEEEEEALYAWEDQIKKREIGDDENETTSTTAGEGKDVVGKMGGIVRSPADVPTAFLKPDTISSISSSPSAEGEGGRGGGGITGAEEDHPPGVREQETVRVPIRFTPKTLTLPTRSRGDEEYYRKSRYKPVCIEDSPMFWKEKGDVFYRNHEFSSAADAYGESIKRDGVFLTCVMNRAACYLQLMEYEKCIQDASLALNILANTPSSDLSQDRYRFLMCKLHARRGAALVWSDDLCRGLQDYRMAAAYADPETDTKTKKDLEMIKALMKKRNVRMAEEEEDGDEEEEEGEEGTPLGGIATGCSPTGGEEGVHVSLDSSSMNKANTDHRTSSSGHPKPQGASYSRSGACRRKMQAATTAFYKGDYTEADRLYSEILARDPLNGPAQGNRVVIRLLQKNYDAALSESQAIIAQCHEVAQALQQSDSSGGGKQEDAGADSDDEEEEELQQEDGNEDDVEEEMGGEEAEERKARRAANRDLLVLERRAAAKRVKENSSHVYLLLKAYVRGAAALCGKKDFYTAHQYLQSALRITPYDNDLMEDVMRLEEKIRMDTLISASTGGGVAMPKK